MNKRQVAEFLERYFSNFLIHNRFLAELLSLISGTGFEKSFYKILQKQLFILSSLGVLATEMKEFELIGDGIFSMHITGKDFNIRILYCFMPNSQPAFLLPFFERQGKGRTDYSSYLPVAQTRKLEMEAEYNDRQV